MDSLGDKRCRFVFRAYFPHISRELLAVNRSGTCDICANLRVRRRKTCSSQVVCIQELPVDVRKVGLITPFSCFAGPSLHVALPHHPYRRILRL